MAYFFKVVHKVNDDFKSSDHIKLKNTVTSPLFEQFSKEVKESKDYKFLNTNQKHLDVITDCTRIARQNLLDCKATDKEAALFLMLGIAAQATSFVPFNWILAPIAYLYAGFLIKERIPAYKAYTESRDNLVRCAAWALNNEYTTSDDMNKKPVIEMLDLLKTIMTKKQLAYIIVDGPLEKSFLQTIDITDEEKERTLEFQVYGYGQDGSLATLAISIGSYIQAVMKQIASQCMDFVRNNQPSFGY